MLSNLKETREIFVVDDDPAIRDALSIALRAEGYVVQSFSDATALFEVVRMRAPGVIVLDVMLPDQSGLDVLKTLRAEGHPAPVLMITGHGDIPMAVEAIKFGAYDFIQKPFSVEIILDQLKAALSAQNIKDENADKGFDLGDIGGQVLSNREKEVLREIAAGASSKEAGRILGISPRTVEVHRANIMDKLGARNAADLMRIIFSHSN
ncbi:MAG: response regulator transcription factor [Beijerinckiaceae bacterium]